MKLRYEGNGEYIPGVPARDLDDSDIESISNSFDMSHDETVNSLTMRGLYSVVKSAPTKAQTQKPETVEGD